MRAVPRPVYQDDPNMPDHELMSQMIFAMNRQDSAYQRKEAKRINRYLKYVCKENKRANVCPTPSEN